MKNKLIISLLIIIASYSTYSMFFKTKEENYNSSKNSSILSNDTATSHKTTELYPKTPTETSSIEKISSNSSKVYTERPTETSAVEKTNSNSSEIYTNNIKKASDVENINSSSSSTTGNNSTTAKPDAKTITISSFLNNLKCTNYVLKPQETLTQIARKYKNTCNLNTSIKLIKSINKISDGDNLDSGRMLLIPESIITTGVMHPVIAGDTWYSIAKKHYDTYDVDSITKVLIYINDLPNNDLPLGESIFLPSI